MYCFINENNKIIEFQGIVYFCDFLGPLLDVDS